MEWNQTLTVAFTAVATGVATRSWTLTRAARVHTKVMRDLDLADRLPPGSARTLLDKSIEDQVKADLERRGKPMGIDTLLAVVSALGIVAMAAATALSHYAKPQEERGAFDWSGLAGYMHVMLLWFGLAVFVGLILGIVGVGVIQLVFWIKRWRQLRHERRPKVGIEARSSSGRSTDEGGRPPL